MFDGLKDKLGSFTEDVEDAAEEEPATEDAAGDGAEPTADGTPEAEDAESTAAAEATATAGSAGAEPAEPDSSESDAEDDPDTGFARKAKSLATGKIVIEEEDLEDPLWDLEMALLESDVSMSVAEAILERVEAELVGETRKVTEGTAGVVEEALQDALLEVVGVGQFDVEAHVADAEKPITIVFTGVNGVGKTTSIAKVVRWLEERGYSSVVANGDTYRAGANEQLQEHADALDVPCITHEQGGDPTAVIYDAVEYAEANDVDVVLGDTAGRLHTDEGLMDQLAKIDRVVGPDLTLFVDEAVAGQDAIERAREFDDAAAIDGAILTKADADSSGGAAISIAHVTGKPVLFLGVGQGYDDLERFDPEWLVEQLFEA
jgi:fused signal recognition particle receptor